MATLVVLGIVALIVVGVTMIAVHANSTSSINNGGGGNTPVVSTVTFGLLPGLTIGTVDDDIAHVDSGSGSQVVLTTVGSINISQYKTGWDVVNPLTNPSLPIIFTMLGIQLNNLAVTVFSQDFVPSPYDGLVADQVSPNSFSFLYSQGDVVSNVHFTGNDITIGNTQSLYLAIVYTSV